MAKVIGLSGPQGGGKSTLLNGLKDRGIAVDDFKVSRKVQADLGWESLDNATSSVSTMVMFQDKIKDVKYERDYFNSKRTDVDVILTERTFADIASYTQLWAWELVHEGKWSVSDAVTFSLKFVDECARFQHVYDGNLLLPFMPHIAWQADPNRAKQKDVGFIVEQLDRFFEVKNPKDVPVFRITEGSVNGRIEQVYNWINGEIYGITHV